LAGQNDSGAQARGGEVKEVRLPGVVDDTRYVVQAEIVGEAEQHIGNTLEALSENVGASRAPHRCRANSLQLHPGEVRLELPSTGEP
jgi:hypothetical protein